MELFKPAWLSKDGEKASKAVEKMKITDQDKLSRAAIESQWYFVRQEAVLKLTDQITLSKVAVNDPEDYVRETAVKKLNDQFTLGYVAKNDKCFHIRIMATEKLIDQNLACEMFDEMTRYNLNYKLEEEIKDTAYP